MDIIFQSGEFYNEPDFISTLIGALSSLLGALISGLIAIWIFRRGIKQQEKKEIQRLQDLRIFYESTLNQLRVPIRKQIDSIQKFCKDLKRKEFDVFDFEFIIGLDLDHLSSISTQDLFRIYTEQNNPQKSELFHELLTQINLIAALKKSLREYFDEYLTNFKRFEKDFQTNAEEVVVLYTNFSSEALRVNPDDELIVGIRDCFVERMRLAQEQNIPDANDPYFVLEHLLNPIYNFISGHQMDPRSPLIAGKIRNARFAMENVENLKRIFRRAFLLAGRSFLTAELKISFVLNELEKR